MTVIGGKVSRKTNICRNSSHIFHPFSRQNTVKITVTYYRCNYHYHHGLWNPEAQFSIHKGYPIIAMLSRINQIPRICLRSILISSSYLLTSIFPAGVPFKMKIEIEKNNSLSIGRKGEIQVILHKSMDLLISSILNNYSLAQQPLKSFDRLLMRVSLSDSILVTLIFY